MVWCWLQWEVLPDGQAVYHHVLWCRGFDDEKVPYLWTLPLSVTPQVQAQIDAANAESYKFNIFG